jgi:hypothetical protein
MIGIPTQDKQGLMWQIKCCAWPWLLEHLFPFFDLSLVAAPWPL